MNGHFLTSCCFLSGIKNAGKVKRDKKLHEWGMDSLMSAEIKDVIDQEFNNDIPLETLASLNYGYLLDLNKIVH